MSTSHSLRSRGRLLAIAGLAALSLSAGVLAPPALATPTATASPTLPPTPTPTPGPQPYWGSGLTGTATATTVQLSLTGAVFPGSTDFSEYTVYQDGVGVAHSYAPSASITGLQPNTTYSFYAVASNAAYQQTVTSNTITITTAADDGSTPPTPTPTPPTPTPTPTAVTPTPCPLPPWAFAPTVTDISGITSTTASVTWTQPQFPACLGGGPVGVDSYVVETSDGVQLATTPAGVTSASLTGLTPGTTYDVQVYAVEGPHLSRVSASSEFTTVADSSLVNYAYNAAGAATLKTLTKGTLPLSGTIVAQLDLSTSAFTASLGLNETHGNLTALGFLPITAKVDIVPTAPVTGNLTNGVLTADAKVRIKIPSVTLAGISLGGGSGCQAGSVSDIQLKSTDAFFAPTKGGTLAGTFGISTLVNCGFLTGLISPLTSGTGNAIVLRLTPPTAS